MTITFGNDNDVIVYALEKIISYARDNQHIFLAQSVWWISSDIGLQQGLVNHIDTLRDRKVQNLQEQHPREDSIIPRSLAEDQRVNQVLDETEQFQKASRRLKKVVALNATGKIITDQISPTKEPRQYLKKSKRVSKEVAVPEYKGYSNTEGIDASEISRRNAAGECLHCAWPCDKKGGHRAKNCRRHIQFDNGTAIFPRDQSCRGPVRSPGEGDVAESSNSEHNIH